MILKVLQQNNLIKTPYLLKSQIFLEEPSNKNISHNKPPFDIRDMGNNHNFQIPFHILRNFLSIFYIFIPLFSFTNIMQKLILTKYFLCFSFVSDFYKLCYVFFAC